MRIAITGATGLVGAALSSHLRKSGHDVVPVVRTAPKHDEISWSVADRRIDPTDLAGVDAVVHLAGAGIGDHRWTDAYKEELLRSRTVGTTILSEAIAAAVDGPRVLVSASAIGYYGDRGDEILDESSDARRRLSRAHLP